MIDMNQFLRLVVKCKDHVILPHRDAEVIHHYFLENDLLPFKNLLKFFPGVRIRKLFTSLKPGLIIELVNLAVKMDPDYQAPDFLAYYAIDCPAEIYSDEMIRILLGHNNVELAYIETASSLPPSTSDITKPIIIHQGYLMAAPIGINALYAWGQKGGDGKGLKFIDIEQGWNLDQENFPIGTFPSTGLNFPVFKDHGDSVLGVILMPHDSSDGLGIAPEASGYVISQWRPDGSFNTADAIMYAVSQLEYGDILLLEAQILNSSVNDGLWPVEIQDAVFDSIRLATALGITVIEAGGNGTKNLGAGNDLDHYADSKGRNTLNPTSPDSRDSGAILVAGGSDKIPHGRIRHSNFGKRIDCYAWGERVSTAGSHLGPADIAIHAYRQKISGTSSATAIVAGVAILVQSIAESHLQVRFSPKQMRQILSDDLLGTPSANGRTIDKIGVMPDLKKIIEHILL